MNKSLKFILISLGVLILAILILMIIIPFFFKDKIKDTVVEMANKELKAKVAIDDFGLNFFTNFPNATLSLKDVSIVGEDQFQGDTLLYADNFSITIDLKSVFKDTYVIRNIKLSDAGILAKVAKDGQVNWDITYEAEAPAETSKDEDDMRLSLNNIEIKNTNIKYVDEEGDMVISLKNVNSRLSGDFSSDETTLLMKFISDDLSVSMSGIPYMSKVILKGSAEIHADFKNSKYTFKDSKFYLNDLLTTIDGSVTMLNEDDLDFDLRLAAPDATFKQILSLIPAMYNNDMKGLKTAGSVSLDAYLVGQMTETKYPAVNLNLAIKDAMFQYPSLPKAVEDINLYLSINGKVGDPNNMQINLNKFGFRIDDNRVNASLQIEPQGKSQLIKAMLAGKLNLASIKDIYPLPKGTNLDGLITSDININTTKSAIENERFDEMNVIGNFKLADMNYKSDDFLPLAIKLFDLNFTSNIVKLNDLNLTVGESDFRANGSLQNMLGYLFNNKTMSGNLNLGSNKINADQLMPYFTDEDETTQEMEKVEIPTNIDFVMNSSLNSVIFNDIDITKVTGTITLKDGALILDKLTANILGGVTDINAKYNSVPVYPDLSASFSLAGASFKETFMSFESVKKIAPIFSDINGDYTMNMSFTTTIYDEEDKTLRALNGKGVIMTNDFKLEGSEALKKLGALLKTNQLDKITSKDITIPFEIKDGAITTKPFDISLGDGGNINLQGVTRLDQSIDYKGTVQLPKSADNKYISKVPLTITGTFSQPKISIDAASAAKDVVGNIAGNIFGGKDKDSEDKAKKFDEEKEKRIEELRKTANDAADKIVEVAKTQSEELVKKAGDNKLAKIAAQKAADEVVKKAEKEAENLRNQAEEQIKKLEKDDKDDKKE